MSPAPGVVVEVGGLGSEACNEPALDDGGPGVALDVIAAGRADGAGSLISQAVVGAITVTKPPPAHEWLRGVFHAVAAHRRTPPGQKLAANPLLPP